MIVAKMSNGIFCVSFNNDARFVSFIFEDRHTSLRDLREKTSQEATPNYFAPLAFLWCAIVKDQNIAVSTGIYMKARDIMHRANL